MFDNKLDTSFSQALNNPDFVEWCKSHDRISLIADNFPLPTTIILYRRSDGKFICIEGNHRVCAVAYRDKIGKPITFTDKPPVSAVVADVTDEEVLRLIQVMNKGTDK